MLSITDPAKKIKGEIASYLSEGGWRRGAFVSGYGEGVYGAVNHFRNKLFKTPIGVMGCMAVEVML